MNASHHKKAIWSSTSSANIGDHDHAQYLDAGDGAKRPARNRLRMFSRRLALGMAAVKGSSVSTEVCHTAVASVHDPDEPFVDDSSGSPVTFSASDVPGASGADYRRVFQQKRYQKL